MFIAVAPLSLSRRSDVGEALIRRFHLGRLRSNRSAWEKDQLKTSHNDAIFRSQTGLHDAQSIRRAAEDDVLALRCVPRSDDVNVLPVLVRKNGFVVDQQRLPGSGALQLNACEQAGCQRVVRVGKHDASSNRTGRWIELVVNEVDVTRVREVLLISQSNTDWILRADTGTG